MFVNGGAFPAFTGHSSRSIHHSRRAFHPEQGKRIQTPTLCLKATRGPCQAGTVLCTKGSVGFVPVPSLPTESLHAKGHPSNSPVGPPSRRVRDGGQEFFGPPKKSQKMASLWYRAFSRLFAPRGRACIIDAGATRRRHCLLPTILVAARPLSLESSALGFLCHVAEHP